MFVAILINKNGYSFPTALNDKQDETRKSVLRAIDTDWPKAEIYEVHLSEKPIAIVTSADDEKKVALKNAETKFYAEYGV